MTRRNDDRVHDAARAVVRRDVRVHDADRAVVTRRDDDRGAVLILVLVLVVVASLIVLPLMSYTMSVLRLNTAVSHRTQDREAAKGGLRAALSDPLNIFLTCDGGGSLETITVNNETVTTSCAELDEIGPLEALGFEVPIGAVAFQLGAEVPGAFEGTTAQSPPVPAYPPTADWWTPQIPVPTGRPPAVSPPDVVEAWDAQDGLIWLPELPRFPGTPRPQAPYSMPASFDCVVYFPGRYTQPLTLDGSHGSTNYYFASGVYYFEQPITVTGDADVIVGTGLAEFGTDCADDLQVATNVIGGPSTFAIDGGGATWVFGDAGRLVVDDSAGGSPSIRFNQRYSDEDRGGRVNIMTVNGDPSDSTAAHDVPFVSFVPRSQVLNTTDDTPPNDLSEANPIVFPGSYRPSSNALTDAARTATAPTGFTVEERVYDDGGLQRALLLTWDHLDGNAGGGSPIERYEIEVVDSTSTPVGTGCQPADVAVTALGPPVELSCVVTGLIIGEDYDASVAGVNAVGVGAAATQSSTPAASVVTAPDAPANVDVVETDVTGTARIEWDAPDANGAPITSYTVTAEEVLDPVAVSAPVAAHPDVATWDQTPVVVDVPAYSRTGDDLTLSIDTTPLGWTVTPGPRPLSVTLTPDSTAGIDQIHTFDYTVTDTGLRTASEVIEVDYTTLQAANQPAVATAMTLDVDAGTTVTERVPAYDPDGDPVTITVDPAPNDPGVVPAEWTVNVTGPDLSDVELTTTAAAGTYTLPYQADDGTGPVDGIITVEVNSLATFVDTCTVVPPASVPTTPARPITEWYELPTTCEISGLSPLPPGANGYRFSVVATNAIGDSPAGLSAIVPPSDPFDGGGSPATPAPLASFDPYEPQPIIEIVASGAGTTTVEVAGYVSVPMGQIEVVDPAGEPIRMVGGVLAGTFDVPNAWWTGPPESVPVGFKNDIVLQRKVRITSVAGKATSTAIVQVNEDGAGYSINAWVVD